MSEVKQIFTSGKMNKDLDERIIPNGEYRDALNLNSTASEGENVGSMQNLLGNEIVHDVSSSLSNAKTIGSIKSDIDNKLYWFITSDTLDGIYEYNQKTNKVSPILIDKKDTVSAYLENITISSNDDYNLIIEKGFTKSDIEQVIGNGINDSTAGSQTEVRNSVSLYNDRYGINIDIPKNTIIEFTKDGHLIFYDINYSGSDFVSIKLGVTYNYNNILNFDPDKFITGVNIIDGLLFWTDDFNQPRKLNINKFRKYSDDIFDETTKIDDKEFSERQISVAKMAPLSAPSFQLHESTYGGVNLIANKTINFFSKDAVGDPSETDIELTNIPDSVSWQKNDLIKATAPSDLGEAPEVDLKVINIVDPADTTITERSKMTSTSLTFTLRIVSIELNDNDTSYVFDLESQEGKSLYELKFPTFSYRWRYKDGEYSVFAPFSETAFLPGKFKYNIETGYNEAMENNAQLVALSDIEIGHDDVEEIDIIYKDSRNSNVYTIDTIKRTNVSGVLFDGTYKINKEKIDAVIESNQLLRQWDNVPRKAKAQEITGNRLIFGNYLQNYNITVPTTLDLRVDTNDDSDFRSIKSNRNYQVGVVFIDEFNRQSPVQTASADEGSSTLVIDGNRSNYNNAITAKVTSPAPAWAKHFKYFIKETSMEYYNLALDNIYQERNDTGFVWLSFSSNDINKIRPDKLVDDFIVLKKEHSTDIPVPYSKEARFKVLDIKRDPPAFLSEQYNTSVQLNKVIFSASPPPPLGSVGGYVIRQTTAKVNATPYPGGTKIGIRGSDDGKNGTNGNGIPAIKLENEVSGKPLIKSGMYIDFSRPGYDTRITNKYLIKKVVTETSGDIELGIEIEGSFGNDVNILYENDNLSTEDKLHHLASNSDFQTSSHNDEGETDIVMSVYEKVKDPALDAKFSGRFFVKVRNQSTVEKHLMEAMISADVSNYITDSVVDIYGKDQSAYDKKCSKSKKVGGKDRRDRSSWFIKAGGEAGPGSVQFGSDTYNFHVIGSTCIADKRVFGGLKAGDKIKFTKEPDILYEVTKVATANKELWYWPGSSAGKKAVSTLNCWFSVKPYNNDTVKQGLVNTVIQAGDDKSITIQKLRLDAETFDFKSANPAVFETEPRESPTELDIYYETQDAYSIDEIGNEQKLRWYNCFTFNGVESNRIRDDYNNPTIAKGVRVSTTLAEKYKEERVFNGLIHSGIINSKNSVNRSNEFIQAEAITKNLLPSFGSVQKLHARDNDIVVFCENKVVKVLSDKDILYNADGSGNVRASRTPLGTTTAYQGEFGIGKNPESFASFGYRAYFTDAPRGNVLRLSGDGIERISRYGMVNFWQNAFVNHSRFIGSYDESNNLYNLSVPCLHTTCFDDAVNGWTTRKSWVPECGISLNNNFYTYNTGDLWVHNSKNAKRNNFYGDQYLSSLQCTMNESPSIIKRFRTLGYEGSNGWKGKVVTDQNKSSVISFTDKENKYFAHLKGEAKKLENLNYKNFSVQGIGMAEDIELFDSASSSNTKKNIKVIIEPKAIPGINCGQTKIADKGLPFIETTVGVDSSNPENENVVDVPADGNKKVKTIKTAKGNNTVEEGVGKVKITNKELLDALEKAENLDDVGPETSGFLGEGDIILEKLESSTGDGTVAKVDEGGDSVIIQIEEAEIEEEKFTVSGSIASSITNATITAGESTYEEIGFHDSYELVQTRTITPNANYTIDTSKIIVNNPRVLLKTSDNGDGSFDLHEFILIGDKDETGVNYTVSLDADPVANPDLNLYNFYTNKTSISDKGDWVTITVTGEVGASGRIIISNASNVQLETKYFELIGSVPANIMYKFPPTTVSTTYTITLDADSGTKLADISLETPITITQNVDTGALIQYSVNSSNYESDITYTSGTKNLQQISGTIGKSLGSTQTISWSIAPPSGKQWTIIRDVDSRYFSTVSGVNNNIQYQSISTSLNGSSPYPLEITAKVYTSELIGDQSIVLNIDDIVGISSTITFTYVVPGGSNYTAAGDALYGNGVASNNSVAFTGISGTTNTYSLLQFNLTPNSTYDFDLDFRTTAYLKANFELKEGSDVVTDTYIHKWGYSYDGSGKWILRPELKQNMLFPKTNKTINVSTVSGSSFGPENATKTGTNFTIALVDSNGNIFRHDKIQYNVNLRVNGKQSGVYQENVIGTKDTSQSKTVNLGSIVKPGFTFSGTSSPSVTASVKNVTDSSKTVSINSDGELVLAVSFVPTDVNPSVTYIITAAEQVRNYTKVPISHYYNTSEAAQSSESKLKTFTYTTGDPDNLEIGDEFGVLIVKNATSEMVFKDHITLNANLRLTSQQTGFVRYKMSNDWYIIGVKKGVIDYIQQVPKAKPIPQPPTIDSPLTITKNTLTDFSVTFNVGDYGISKPGLSTYVVYSSLYSEGYINSSVSSEAGRRAGFEQLANNFTNHDSSTDKPGNNKAVHTTIEKQYVVGAMTNNSGKNNLLKGSQTLNVLKPKMSSLHIPNDGWFIDANGYRMKYQPEIYGRVFLKNKDGAWMWSDQFEVPKVLDKKISELEHSDATVQFNNRVNPDNTVSTLIKASITKCDPGENVYLGIAINRADSATPMEAITNQTFATTKDYNVYVTKHKVNPPLSYDTPTVYDGTKNVARNDILPMMPHPNKYDNLKTLRMPDPSNPTRWKDGVEYAWHIGHAKDMRYALSGGYNLEYQAGRKTKNYGQINGLEAGVTYNYRVFAYRGNASMIAFNSVNPSVFVSGPNHFLYNALELGYQEGQDPTKNNKLGGGKVGGYSIGQKDYSIKNKVTAKGISSYSYTGFENAEIVSLHSGSFTTPAAFKPNINLGSLVSNNKYGHYIDLTATLTSTGMYGIDEAGIIITASDTNLLDEPSNAKSVELGSSIGEISKIYYDKYTNKTIEFALGKTYKIPFFRNTDVSTLAASSGLSKSETNTWPYVEGHGGGGLPSYTKFWINWYTKDKFGSYLAGDTPVSFTTDLGQGYEINGVTKGPGTFSVTTATYDQVNVPDVCCPSKNFDGKVYKGSVVMDTPDMASATRVQRHYGGKFSDGRWDYSLENYSNYYRKQTSSYYYKWDAKEKTLTRGKCPRCPSSTDLGLSATPNNVPLTPPLVLDPVIKTPKVTDIDINSQVRTPVPPAPRYYPKVNSMYQLCTEWDDSMSTAENLQKGKKYWVELTKGVAYNVGQKLTVSAQLDYLRDSSDTKVKTVKVGISNTIGGPSSVEENKPGTHLVPFLLPPVGMLRDSLPVPYGSEYQKFTNNLTPIASAYHDSSTRVPKYELKSFQKYYEGSVRSNLNFISEQMNAGGRSRSGFLRTSGLTSHSLNPQSIKKINSFNSTSDSGVNSSFGTFEYQKQLNTFITSNSSVLASAYAYSEAPTLNDDRGFEQEFVGDNQFIIGADNTTNTKTEDYPSKPMNGRYLYTKNPLEVYRPDGSIYGFYGPLPWKHTYKYTEDTKFGTSSGYRTDYGIRFMDCPLIFNTTAANQIMAQGNIRKLKLAMANGMTGALDSGSTPTTIETLLGSGYTPTNLPGNSSSSMIEAHTGTPQHSFDYKEKGRLYMKNANYWHHHGRMNFSVAENAGPLFLFRFDNLIDNYPCMPGHGPEGYNNGKFSRPDSQITSTERADHIGARDFLADTRWSDGNTMFPRYSIYDVSGKSITEGRSRFDDPRIGRGSGNFTPNAFYDKANDRWYSIGTHVYDGRLLAALSKGGTDVYKGGFSMRTSNPRWRKYYNFPNFGNYKYGDEDTFIQRIDKEGW